MSVGNPRRQLVVLVDALGWLTVERTRFLSDLLPFRRRLTTVFGFSSTAVPTLLTGAWPREHGHWFLFRRAMRGRPFREAGWVDRFGAGLGRRWKVRSHMQEYWRKKNNIRGYFSIYNIPFKTLAEMEPVELRDTWKSGSFPETPSLMDWLEARGERCHVSDWRVPDAQKVEAALEIVSREDPKTVVLYLTEVDAAQHLLGSDHPDLDLKLSGLAKDIRRVADAMGRRGPVGLTLFSDHGMADVVAHRDILGELVSRGLVRDRDFCAFVDSTVARFWNIKDRSRLAAALGGLTWGRVLDESLLDAWGCRFPMREYGDVFFLADTGVLILPSDMGADPIAGMHGYDPSHPSSDACFLADTEVPLSSSHITAVLDAVKYRVLEGV